MAERVPVVAAGNPNAPSPFFPPGDSVPVWLVKWVALSLAFVDAEHAAMVQLLQREHPDLRKHYPGVFSVLPVLFDVLACMWGRTAVWTVLVCACSAGVRVV